MVWAYPVNSKLISKTLGEDIISHDEILPFIKKGTVLTETHIRFLERKLQLDSVLIEEPSEVQFERTYTKCIEDIENFFACILEKYEDHQTLNLRSYTNIYMPVLDCILESDRFLTMLSLKHSDKNTYTHSLNVSIIASIIGKILGLNKSELLKLGEMGLLHDIGKLLVPTDIITKQQPLTKKEWNEIKRHPMYGIEILRDIGEDRDYIHSGVLLHHERMDGSGYPLGRLGATIPFLVQILMVADTFDAITSKRAYREEASPLKGAIEIMKDTEKGQLNRAITIPFVKHIMWQYVREKVVLSNGQVVEICFIFDESPHLPLVKDEQGQYIDLRYNIDLKIIKLHH